MKTNTATHEEITEDMLVTLHATALAVLAFEASNPQAAAGDAKTLWETHISEVLKHRYPHHKFEQRVLHSAIELALRVAKESREPSIDQC